MIYTNAIVPSAGRGLAELRVQWLWPLRRNSHGCKAKELRKSYQARESSYATQFCSTCGSRVPIHIADKKLFWIPVGLLDSDPGIPLTKHVYIGSKAPWEILDEHTEQFVGGFEL
ncbi:MAG: hypothetical protein DRR42_10720 [Gammaproteobacteria bacterium]|nr:MAG: hypothetical protein DRR42_10720 [Gammaproteobacteria bacterium]